MLMNHSDYGVLHEYVFSAGYPGYKPEVVEAPNGDGRLDTGKRYAHIARKYGPHPEALVKGFEDLCILARNRAIELGIPSQYWPDVNACALRILEYPQNVGSAAHTDFDLFTINCYRSDKNALQAETSRVEVPKDVHLGELYDEVMGTKHARLHWVMPLPKAQFSVVFFAMPAHNAVLPSGQAVGQWLEERYARSRVPAKEKQ
jgi:hypothetical protein